MQGKVDLILGGHCHSSYWERIGTIDLIKSGSDFEEFSRWYFTGMKPYNGSTKSMLIVANQTPSIFDALKNKNIADIIKNN